MKRITVSLLLVAILVAVAGSPAAGAGTKLWNFTRIETWLQGKFHGTGLTSRGNVVPTMLTESTSLPARLAWKSVDVRDGQLIATSLPAGVFHRSQSGTVSKILSLDQLGVTAMEKVGNRIYAAATPTGTIYRYNPDKRNFSRYRSLSDSFVWDMEPAPNNQGLYLATGPGGVLYHLSGEGNLRSVGNIPGHNIMDLAIHKGTVYLGSDRGGVYRLANTESSSHLKSVYGFTRGEVGAIASDGEYLYLAVNVRQASGRKQQQQQQISALAAQLRQQAMRKQLKQRIKTSPRRALMGASANTPAQPPVRGPSPVQKQSTQSMLEAVRKSSGSGQSKLFQGLSGTLVYRMKPPKKMNIVYNDPNEIVHDLEAANGKLYIASGGKGRLYKIKPDFTRIAFFQSDHKLVLDVELEKGRPETITTGEGGAVFQRKPFNKKEVYYRSPTLDAQLLSQWGTLKSIGSSDLRFRTRSGNSNEPDTNWSPWSPFHSGNRFSIPSEPARFLQFEARFNSPKSQLKNVQIAYSIPNQQPQISTFDISPNPYRMMATQSHSPGSSNGKSASPSASNSKQAPQSTNGSVRQIAWKAVDPDGDSLKAVIYYRPLGATNWLTLAESEDLKGSTYKWNLANYSDGRYELKLEVSDQAQNPPGEGYTAYQQLGPVLVDNTAPQIRKLKRTDGTVSFAVRDETSWILRAQYRIDGGDWHPLQPEDGIFDQRTEQFEFELPKETADRALIEIRTMDEGGNVTLSRIDEG